MRIIDADKLIEKLSTSLDNPEEFPIIGLGTIMRMIDAEPELPPAQPEQPWILCDERMPEEHEWIGTKSFGTTMSDEVYVTFENSKGERFTKHIHFHNGDLSRYDKTHMDAWFKGSKPIAWMPLPEPYRPEGEEHG